LLFNGLQIFEVYCIPLITQSCSQITGATIRLQNGFTPIWVLVPNIGSMHSIFGYTLKIIKMVGHSFAFLYTTKKS